jgi:hypothetical protein
MWLKMALYVVIATIRASGIISALWSCATCYTLGVVAALNTGQPVASSLALTNQDAVWLCDQFAAFE